MTLHSGATLTWLDLTSADRDKVRRVLDLFKEKGTVDELGLGTLRDLLADTLFPGTSVLHTRLRYVLFIPWIYQHLESRVGKLSNVDDEARALEIRLIGALKTREPSGAGIIGVEAHEELRRLPSSVYWAALARWGIFAPGQSQGWYHRHFRRLASQREQTAADDPGLTWTKTPTWHLHLPRPPTGFLEKTTFALTREEAVFVQQTLETRVQGSLLGQLAAQVPPSIRGAANLWDVPEAWKLPPNIRLTVELARRFSLHVEGAALLYNLLLAEKRQALQGQQTGKDADLIDSYRQDLSTWAEVEAAEESFDHEALWTLAARQGVRLRPPQKAFLKTWTEQVAENGPARIADSDSARDLLTRREISLKGARARVKNVNRLLDWSGRTGVGRMGFRWSQVRRLLMDLQDGLAA
ncbi:DUF6361 family protein [Methylonatrum kenyense]|uniref:DUF6361 family protein n=1 Tax=Methylonatrum kenyense TaxID=455253 RepID=UPI0020C0B95E|nr:DUF6361 family protein [Methylonatrum kenyense]MCK8514982.1 DUF6361 family protein [Methylonatrum kenyense]